MCGGTDEWTALSGLYPRRAVFNPGPFTTVLRVYNQNFGCERMFQL